MRTTLNIDDTLLSRLQAIAREEGISLTAAANRALELGLARLSPAARVAYDPPTFNMGQASFNLDKALQFAADLEDEEIVRKLQMRK